MTGTEETLDWLHRLAFALGLVASAIVVALAVLQGHEPEYGAAVPGALLMASATFGYRPNLAALRSR